MDARDIVVRTAGLSKAFDGVEVVSSLDLTVGRHSIFGFLGPNGAGKTTTMKMLLGLLRPSSGDGAVFGLDIEKDSVAVRSRVGYLPQEPRFYDHMTARETLRFTAGFFYAGPRAAIERRVDECLALVGLADKADRRVKALSGGERQRLGLAQAQVNEPELLILDEPAASLDPLGRRDVLAVLEDMRQTATVIYSTHILDDVQRVSDTVAILDRGVLVAQGPINHLLAGSGGTTFILTLAGDAVLDDTLNVIRAFPWTADVAVTRGDGETTLAVAVADVAAAEAYLLRAVLADGSIVVKEYRRREYALDDVFLDVVAGGRQ